MLSRQDRWQDDLFVAGPLRELIPDDHPLRRIDNVLDLSWLRDEVKDCYCLDNGRPGIDPEAAVRLMLAGLLEGIVHDRKLMRQAQVNLAIRWFAGYRLNDKLPNHSSLSVIRKRWGVERFARIFVRTVTQCVDAGLVKGDLVHMDATLIRADVSWESLVLKHVQDVLDADADGSDPSKPPKSKPKKYSPTDPDATMTTSNNQQRMEPCFKQHTSVDDEAGVVVDVAVTTGEASEGRQLMDQIARVEANTGQPVQTVTADAGYAHAANYEALSQREITAVIPPQRAATGKRIPSSRFRYDAKRDVVRCPRGRTLHRSSPVKNGWMYRARTKACRACPLRSRCISGTSTARTVLIVNGYVALLRARRTHARGDPEWQRLYNRHRGLVEGRHGEAKTQHRLGRAARRGLWNVAIQAYLTAAVMNLKRLAAHAALLWPILWPGPREVASEAPLCAHQFVPDARRAAGRRRAA